MKSRGKSVKTEQEKQKFISNSNNFLSSSSPNLSCKKHPLNPSSVGICAYCLNEKLIKLVCSDCGEQRISSCSCSVFSSYRNSSCTVDIGSVERISNLIEIERGSDRDNPKTLFSYLKMKQSETGDVGLLKRSNSCVVEVKKTIGFWKIGKLFRKKRDKQGSSERNRVGFDQDYDVSRSRSLSSFMGDKFHHEICTAKISDFNESERRKSGFKGGLMDFESGFVVKEMDFGITDDRIEDNDDDEFIDLKFDLSDKSKTEHSVFKKHDQLNSIGSSRIMVNDRGIKKLNNSHMQSWKWMFKNQSENNDHNHILKS